jgi:hypothetical protein
MSVFSVCRRENTAVADYAFKPAYYTFSVVLCSAFLSDNVVDLCSLHVAHMHYCSHYSVRSTDQRACNHLLVPVWRESGCYSLSPAGIAACSGTCVNGVEVDLLYRVITCLFDLSCIPALVCHWLGLPLGVGCSTHLSCKR